jgi:hypothetical protein
MWNYLSVRWLPTLFILCLVSPVLAQDDAPALQPGSTGEVVFLCNGEELAVLAELQFVHQETGADVFPLYIYGLDGLLPAIRVQAPDQDIDVCHRDAQNRAGDTITLPGAEPVTLQPDQLEMASQLTINSPDTDLGTVTITFGAEQDAPGRYLAVVGGFSIDPNDNVDLLRLHPGALPVRETTMQVYMVGVGANNRLDPSMRFADGSADCDDAGRRACSDVPSVSGVGVVFSEGGAVTGDRFDAGLSFEVGDPLWRDIAFSSFSGRTGGDYALLITGELPPRSFHR